MKIKSAHWSSRGLSLLLAVILAVDSSSLLVWAAAAGNAATDAAPAPAETPVPFPLPRKSSRLHAKGPPESFTPKFSQQPTESEIRNSRVFAVPLTPIGVPRGKENSALADIILKYLKRTNSADHSLLSGFIEQYPKSAWNPALLVNLGIAWRHAGHFSKAMAAWETSWTLSKAETDLDGRALADRALGELLQMNAWVGRFEKLEPLLDEIKDRPLIGGAAEMVSSARQGLWVMKNEPERGFMCGPYALRRLMLSTGTNRSMEALLDATSTPNGTSLAQLKELAQQSGLSYQIAKRSPGSEFIPNSVIHWKLNHFGALVKERNGEYLVQDSTFSRFYGQELWIGKTALEEESSGYFLVPEGTLPKGWRTVSLEEGASVWGKGEPGGLDPDACTKCDEKAKKCPCSKGMAQYNAHLMLVSLNIEDTPLSYNPPVGPAVNFTLTYNQRDRYAQSNPKHSNVGINWTIDWISYIIDKGASGNRDIVRRYVDGGGAVTHKVDAQSGLYAHDRNGAYLRYIASPESYELTFPDGSKQIFSKPVTATAGSDRKMLMTSIVDPVGNALQIHYDSACRIVEIEDALGQSTYVRYASADSYRINEVEDPSGRVARLVYDTWGRLKQIRDVEGMVSSFIYKAGNFGFIESMSTPYGTSRFDFGEANGTRWLTMTDANGNTEKVIYQSGAINHNESEEPDDVWNVNLGFRNTFYYDKNGFALSNGNNPAYATIYHWLHDDSGGLTSRILESMKKPQESRVYFSYHGQTQPMFSEGITVSLPSRVTRLVDDPSAPSGRATETHAYEYNQWGHVTKYTDPIGRETTVDYYSNGIDVQKVRQTKTATGAGINEVLAEYSGYTVPHRPSTYIDAARQTYSLQWNSKGQLQQVTKPNSETLLLEYDSFGYGYLLFVKQPWAGGYKTTGLTYDQASRIRTVTDSDNYTLTYDYDALDRLTKVTYPDQTFERYVYSRLDLAAMYDRAGKRTLINYDAIGRPISVEDRAGRVTTFGWCLCGDLDSITDPRSQTTTWQRDIQGRVTTKTYPDGKSATYEYNPRDGRLKSVTDSKNQTKNYTYNLDGTLKSVTYANEVIATPDVSFTYDPKYRRLKTMVDGTGTTTFNYNAVTTSGTLGANKRSSVQDPLGTTSFEYDKLGRVTNRIVGVYSEKIQYDELGRITNHFLPFGSFRYAYHGSSDRVHMIASPIGITNVFEYFGNLGDKRLASIENKRQNNARISKFSYQYDVLGRIRQWTQQADSATPNVMTLEYDLEDQLLNAAIAPQGGSIAKAFSYEYDPAGNRTAEQVETTTGGAAFATSSSSYNNVNQLTSRSLGPILFRGKIDEPGTVTVNGQAATMTQDPDSTSNGKIFTASLPLGAGLHTATIVASDLADPPNTTTKTYEVYGNSGQAKTFSYDNNGNCTGYTAGNKTVTYDYDAEDRLVKITQATTGQPTLVSEFTYDGFSRWVKLVEKSNGTVTSTKNFHWDGTQMTCERNGTTLSKLFYAEAELNFSTGPLMYTRDHLGSVREAIDLGGAIRARYDYDPYGRRTKVSGTQETTMGFTGHYYHAPSGLHLALYRAYDADIGRWINRDPIGEAGGLNLYGYVSNDPVARRDRLGLWDEYTYWENYYAQQQAENQIEEQIGANYGYLQEQRDKLDDLLTSAGRALAEEAAMAAIPGGRLGKLGKKACEVIKKGRKQIFKKFPSRKRAKDAAANSPGGPWQKNGKTMGPEKHGDTPPHYHDGWHDDVTKPNTHYQFPDSQY